MNPVITFVVFYFSPFIEFHQLTPSLGGFVAGLVYLPEADE